MANERLHGSWWQNWTTGSGAPGAPAFEGRFVRLFPEGTAHYPPDAITALATAMTADLENPPAPEDEPDDEENRGNQTDPGITAGYTYVGQFIDHDLTLDPTSNLRGQPLTPDQLNALVNFRTPRLDLDCLYGRGPADQPYLYGSDGVTLALGTAMSGNPHDANSVDVPRGPNGRALIGDPRNDENRIVAQLQSAMLRFHNQLVRRAQRQGQRPTFDAIRDQVRWHYQWAVVHDFLPTIVQSDVLHTIFPHLTADPATSDDQPHFSIPALAGADPSAGPLLAVMPVEFSVAAYRFGHSMIRPIYRLNQTIERRQIFANPADPSGDLGGMRPIPGDWAVDWEYFFDIEHSQHPAPAGDDPVRREPQFSYKIDTSLVNPLAHLSPRVAVSPPSLPRRNLMRGEAFSLPTGENVATALGLTPLTPDQILIGKATGNVDDRVPLSSIAHGAFNGKTPLWVYVLAEAWATSWAVGGGQPDPTRPIRLGPVGGRIVAETLAAVLVSDSGSYLNAPAHFRPEPDLCRGGTRFGFAEIINAALGKSPQHS